MCVYSLNKLVEIISFLSISHQWSSHAPEVNFILCRGFEKNSLGDVIHQQQQHSQQHQYNTSNQHGSVLNEQTIASIPGLDQFVNINTASSVSLPRLQEIAHQQHKQIAKQEKAMVDKDQRLKWVSLSNVYK